MNLDTGYSMLVSRYLKIDHEYSILGYTKNFWHVQNSGKDIK
ncbi:hypothetical protein D1BOALGB6SA_8528 [Olavius sp. associated proteobacterium Delta 1]|nr:hypothetical protein D1BOALGB6SA_8528 [Olavius sp. associated proteobacterium Delta 1]